MIDLQSVAIKLSRSENLPVLSQVAHAIIKVADDPSASPKTLERMIEREPAISAKILKVANSAYYGSNVVPSIGRAISVLGINTVRSLITAIAYQQMLNAKAAVKEFDKVRFWKHSLATGTAARILGKLRMPLRAEELYSAGMMHDVGLLVLERFAPEALAEAISLANQDRIPLHEAELQLLGFDHAEVGGLLAEKWSLTESLRCAIVAHHDPLSQPEHLATTAIIAGANTLAQQCGFTTLESTARPEMDPVVESELGMPEDQLEVIRNVLIQEVRRAQDAFGVDLDKAA